MGDKTKWPTFLTVAEVSGILRVSKMSVYRMCQAGDLVSFRVGTALRIDEDAFREYLRQQHA